VNLEKEIKTAFWEWTPYNLGEMLKHFGKTAVSIFRLLWSSLSQYVASQKTATSTNMAVRTEHLILQERQVPWKMGNFLTMQKATSLSRRT
jgi:hypothetical protein